MMVRSIAIGYLWPVFASMVLGLLAFILVRDHVSIIPATAVSLKASRSTAEVGDVIPVDLRVDGLARNLMGFNVVVTYDPSVARLEGVEKPAGGSLLDPLLIHFVDSDQDGGRVEISATRDGGPAPQTSGNLFTLKFRLLRNDEPFSLDYAAVHLRDGSNLPIPIVRQENFHLVMGSSAAEGAGQ